MNEKFIKARVPSALLQALLERAGIEGKRLGTLVREILEHNERAIDTAQALARIEAAVAAAKAGATPLPPAAADHELRREVQELRLIVRELALHHNAQILTRVAAQVAAQTTQTDNA